jgi:hypothetical protein
MSRSETTSQVVDLVDAKARTSTWRDSVTGQWESVRRGLRAGGPGHRPEHAAPPDERADRMAAAGMGLLVLIGAIVTYVAVVGGIDPLLAPAPAGGAPPAVVRSLTPTPTTTSPTTTEPAEVGASTEPGSPRPRPRTTTPRPSVSTPTPTTTTPPATTPPTPTPTPSPSG